MARARSTSELTQCFTALMKEASEKMDMLNRKQDKWTELENAVKENYSKVNDNIKFNVRGKVFEICKTNLLWEESYFKCLLGSGEWKPDKDGAYFIDRRYEGFERILDYLTTGKISYIGLSDYECEVIRDNLDYFQLRATPPPIPLTNVAATFCICNKSSTECLKQIYHLSMSPTVITYTLCPHASKADAHEECESKCNKLARYHGYF